MYVGPNSYYTFYRTSNVLCNVKYIGNIVYVYRPIVLKNAVKSRFTIVVELRPVLVGTKQFPVKFNSLATATIRRRYNIRSLY